jgi:hypothetical protein
MKQSRCCVFDLVAVTRWCLPLTGRSLALPALLALLCSPVAAQTMGSSLIDAGFLPASSADAYGQPFSRFFLGATNDPAQDITAAVPADVTTTDTCAFAAGCMAGSLGGIPKQGGNVAVVDWVLVQLRLVPQGTQAPTDDCRSTPACRDQVTVVTKAALLLSDGSVSSADADDLAEGVLTFDDVDFDPSTHDMYIAVNHRNHLPVLSGKADDADVAPADGDYAYDFTDLDAAFTPETGVGIRGGAVRGNVLVVAAGDANPDSVLGVGDLFAANNANDVGLTGYLTEDVDLTGNMTTQDLFDVDSNIISAESAGVEF